MMSLKKAEYDELVKKVNPIDTSDLIKKADYNITAVEVEKKILAINITLLFSNLIS